MIYFFSSNLPFSQNVNFHIKVVYVDNFVKMKTRKQENTNADEKTFYGKGYFIRFREGYGSGGKKDTKIEFFHSIR